MSEDPLEAVKLSAVRQVIARKRKRDPKGHFLKNEAVNGDTHEADNQSEFQQS